MKLLWASNAGFVGTGYGQQTALVTQSLKADGHDVAVMANYGLQGTKLEWQGIPILPAGYDVWGNDVIGGHARTHFGDDRGWVITLFDVWVAKGPSWKELDVASWVPVDHIPTPPKVVTYFNVTGAVPIAMSQFGQRMLANADLDALYAPHGVDTTTFRPDDFEINGMTPREAFGIPEDAHVVLMNAANKGNHKIRKGFPQAFAAFGLFVKEHPDAVLFMHTEKYGMADGVQLDRLAEACGIPAKNIMFTDQYAYRCGLTPELLAAMYNAADVLLAPSMGEGFGIPVIEAQACGVPVIVSDFSAQPELVGSGWLVDGTPDWDEAQASWLHLPNPGGILDALRESYNGEGVPERARAHALGYDHDLIFDTHWRPIIAELERRHTIPTVDVKPVDVSLL
jgi:glycosyltransferase involved in cell wall biosynthesis